MLKGITSTSLFTLFLLLTLKPFVHCKNVMYTCMEPSEELNTGGIRCTINDFQQPSPNETYSFGALDPNLITELKFKNSQFKQIPRPALKLFDKTQVLDIEGVGLSTFANGDFSDSKVLSNLMAAHNGLTKLVTDTFVGAEQLKWINLSHNQLMYMDKDVFGPLMFMEVLDLSYNRLRSLDKELFSQSTMLRTIFLNNNFLMEIDLFLFHAPTHLESIVLNKNFIEELQLTLKNNHLTYLYATKNRIKRFYLDAEQKDYQDHNFYVELSNNKLNSFYINPLLHPTSLSLSYNYLNDADNITKLTSLTYLDVSFNSFKMQDLQSVSNILTLDEFLLDGIGSNDDKTQFAENSEKLTMYPMKEQEPTFPTASTQEDSTSLNSRFTTSSIQQEERQSTVSSNSRMYGVNEFIDENPDVAEVIQESAILPILPIFKSYQSNGIKNVSFFNDKLESLVNNLNLLENNTNGMNVSNYLLIQDTAEHLKVLHLFLIFLSIVVILLFIFTIFIYIQMKKNLF